MPITTISSRSFNQDTSAAKKAADTGPVIITDRGRPAHVLLSIDAYRQLTGGNVSLIDLLSMPGTAAIDFDPPRMGAPRFRPADLS